MLRLLRGIAGVLLLVEGVSGSAAPPAGGAALDEAAKLLASVSGAKVRPYSTRDFGRERFDGARSALVPEASAERLLRELRPKLPKGIVAFVGVTNSLADPKPSGVELVVAPGRTQLDILRVAASDGINAGLETEDLVRELAAWDREFGIDIWQAETDTVQLRLKGLPKDVAAFARRVHAFCPDIVDQGVGDVEALERAIREDRAVSLWWD